MHSRMRFTGRMHQEPDFRSTPRSVPQVHALQMNGACPDSTPIRMPKGWLVGLLIVRRGKSGIRFFLLCRRRHPSARHQHFTYACQREIPFPFPPGRPLLAPPDLSLQLTVINRGGCPRPRHKSVCRTNSLSSSDSCGRLPLSRILARPASQITPKFGEPEGEPTARLDLPYIFLSTRHAFDPPDNEAAASFSSMWFGHPSQKGDHLLPLRDRHHAVNASPQQSESPKFGCALF